MENRVFQLSINSLPSKSGIITDRFQRNEKRENSVEKISINPNIKVDLSSEWKSAYHKEWKDSFYSSTSNIVRGNNYYSFLKNSNQIQGSFKIVIGALKFLGACPISCETKTYFGEYGGEMGMETNNLERPTLIRKQLRFYLDFTSRTTLTSAVIACLTLILWTLFFINIGIEIPFLISEIVSHTEFDQILREEESSSNPLRGMVKITYCITSTIVIIETVSRWVHSSKFLYFLNKFEGFEDLMAFNFPSTDYEYDFHQTLVKFRDNLLLFYVIYPSMSLIPAFLCVYTVRLGVLGKLLGVLICFQFTAVSLLEDVKCILSYKSIQQSFRVVRVMIQCHMERKEPVNVEKVQNWRKLVQYIRDQCHLAGKYQKFEELTRMLGSIALVTLFTYIVFNGWDHAKERGDLLFVMSSIGYALMLMLRIYFKAVTAENITTEEYLLSRTLMEIDMQNRDTLALLELKTLIDSMTTSPSKIVFGQYVTLNKRLLLGISSQVVSYLIVLMQFSQPN